LCEELFDGNNSHKMQNNIAGYKQIGDKIVYFIKKTRFFT